MRVGGQSICTSARKEPAFSAVYIWGAQREGALQTSNAAEITVLHATQSLDIPSYNISCGLMQGRTNFTDMYLRTGPVY
jgi:hypothetical protein